MTPPAPVAPASGAQPSPYVPAFAWWYLLNPIGALGTDDGSTRAVLELAAVGLAFLAGGVAVYHVAGLGRR